MKAIIMELNVLYLGAHHVIFNTKCYDTEPYHKGRRMVLSAVTPGCPLGSVNRPGLREGPPPAFVRPGSSLQQLIWLLCS